MIESVIEDYVVETARKQGWFCRKVKWLGRRNAPDRLFAKDGRLLFIEFKTPGGKPRAGQQREIKEMQAAGIEVHVCDNPVSAFLALGIDHGHK